MIHPYYRGQDVYVGRSETIAILGLEVVANGPIDEASTRVASQLTDAIRGRAANGPYAIAPNSNAELIDEKVMHSCDDEREACMRAIGRRFHADHLLFGHVERSRGEAIKRRSNCSMSATAG
jgi:hypothetical protein